MAKRHSKAKTGAAQSAPVLRQITILGQKVGGDDGKPHVKGEVLMVGEDCTEETATILVGNGLAIESTGKLDADIQKATTEAEAANLQVLRKQRADTEMARHDQMSADDRERAYEGTEDEGADLVDFDDVETDPEEGEPWVQ